MPRYIVVMPARNASATIDAAVRSVLRTFPQDTRVAVWDDGSTDNTAEAALRAGGRQVTVRYSTESVGGGVARQRIIEATDSEFVVNQDADDISLPWRHRLQAGLLQDADIAFTSVQRFSSRRPHRPSMVLSHRVEDVPIALLFHNMLPHPTMVARREALASVGGYGDMRVAQDYELWLRAARHGTRIRHSGVPCMAQRLSGNQISRESDYAKRVLASTQLVRSYSLLLQQLVPSSTSQADQVQAVQDIAPVDPELLHCVVDRMSRPLRHYYRHLLQNRNFGDLSAAIFVGTKI